MTIEQISEWFQLAAQAMFASVGLGPERGGWTFYQCEDGPRCPWPPDPCDLRAGYLANQIKELAEAPGEVVFSGDSAPLDWEQVNIGTMTFGSVEEAEAAITLLAAEPAGGVH